MRRRSCENWTRNFLLTKRLPAVPESQCKPACRQACSFRSSSPVYVFCLTGVGLRTRAGRFTLSSIDNLPAIASWYLPWNFDETGREVKYNSPNANPIQLSSVPHLMPGFREEPCPICSSSLFPTRRFLHSVGRQPHRMAAIMTAQVPFRLLAFFVHGRVDNAVMPELRHWQQSPSIREWE